MNEADPSKKIERLQPLIDASYAQLLEAVESVRMDGNLYQCPDTLRRVFTIAAKLREQHNGKK